MIRLAAILKGFFRRDELHEKFAGILVFDLLGDLRIGPQVKLRDKNVRVTRLKLQNKIAVTRWADLHGCDVDVESERAKVNVCRVRE